MGSGDPLVRGEGPKIPVIPAKKTLKMSHVLVFFTFKIIDIAGGDASISRTQIIILLYNNVFLKNVSRMEEMANSGKNFFRNSFFSTFQKVPYPNPQ